MAGVLPFARGGHRAGRRNKELLASIGFEDAGGKEDGWEREMEQALLAIRGAQGSKNEDGSGRVSLQENSKDAPEKEPSSKVGGASSSSSPPAPPVPSDDYPNAATKLVIQCLKEGLAKSISSISHRQKDRPLNPRSDFTFKSCINFKERKVGRERKTTKIRTREGDMGCCGGSVATKGDPMDSDSDTLSDDDVEEDEESGSDVGWDGESDRLRELADAADKLGPRRSRAPSLSPRNPPPPHSMMFAPPISQGGTPTATPLMTTLPTRIGEGNEIGNSRDGLRSFGSGRPKSSIPPPILTNRPPPTQSEMHEPFTGDQQQQQSTTNTDAVAMTPVGSTPHHRRVMSYSMKYPMRAPDLDGTISSPISHDAPVHPSAMTYPGPRGQDPSRLGQDALPQQHASSSPTDDRGPREAFTFTDYSPMCYRHIRSFFKVDPKEYREVLCHSRWHSIPTPGKSAAQLFFCGQNWVIKTMTKEESKFLRSILHRYYNHVRDNPGTLLPHFVGHHSISIKGEKITFVIMQNVFATPKCIDEKFDLKGSTVGRYVSEKEKRKKTCTKKDLDINRPIHVGSERRSVLIKQLRVDCLFLERCNIMDYSFLIGVHYHQTPDELDGGRGRAAAAAAERGVSYPMTPATDGGGGMSFIGASPKLSRGGGGGGGVSHQQSDWRFADNEGISSGHHHRPTTTEYESSPLAGGGATTPAPQRLSPVTHECFTEFQGGMLSDALFAPIGSSGALPPHATYDGGPRKHSHEIYYVGIIDILQEYNWWKRGETLVRRATNDVQQVSSVDPHLYSTRFVSFMSSIIT